MKHYENEKLILLEKQKKATTIPTLVNWHRSLYELFSLVISSQFVFLMACVLKY